MNEPTVTTETIRTSQTYWIGDLCYVMHDCWEEVCDLIFPDRETEVRGEMKLADGRTFWIFETAHGDGEYRDQCGNRYGVDSGSLGAIAFSDIRDTSKELFLEGGVVHELSEPLTSENCSYEEGLIRFGPVVIDTDDDEDYEEEDEDYEDEYEADLDEDEDEDEEGDED